MRIIGITGGVGSGKSEVMGYLEKKYEAAVVRADEAAHLLMQQGQACYGPLLELLGTDIKDEEGNLDRRKMAALIFQDKEVRKKVNGIVHPGVKKHIVELIEKERIKGTSFFFVEAALLIEDKYDEICDELWYIYADEHVRRERLMQNRGYSHQKIEGIMASQLSEKEFSEHCDFKIDNGGEFADTIKQIDRRMNTYETL